MSGSSVFMYIIALLLIGITGINLYATMTSKKRKDTANKSYHKIIWPIEERLLSEMKSRGLEYTVVKRMLNDQDQGIIFCADNVKRKAVIAMADSSIHFDFEDLKDSKVEYNTQGKKVLRAEVSATIKDTVYTYEIASKEFNPRSIIGKVLHGTAEDFAKALEDIRKS